MKQREKDRLMEAVAEIIDEVEYSIREANPHLEALVDKESNTFLTGDAYYALEERVLRELKRVRRRAIDHTKKKRPA